MRRPVGIVILALIQAFAGVVLLIGGVALLLGNSSAASQEALSMANLSSDTGTLVSFGVITLILAVVELALAFGLFQLRGWAWGISLILFGANVVLVLMNLVNGQSLTQTQEVSGLVSLLIALYLLLPGVRGAFFSRTPASAA
jgi:hypothetical protein